MASQDPLATSPPATLAQTEAREAVGQLAEWAAALSWEHVPPRVRHRLLLVLLNSLGVTVAGAREDEMRALVRAWDPAGGPAPLVGGGLTVNLEAAAWLNAAAMVALELDEGHKYAKGHPAAHGLHAVLALAAHERASGAETLRALLVGYEVAARFGRATSLRPGAHPHGSWGVPGAAAGCAVLLGLDATGIAAAIDAGAALPVAGHFTTALDGNPVRNAWMGASNMSGLAAARMAQAGLVGATGTAATSLGLLLGEFDPTALVEDLGERWDVELGYFKRHAACSFTHPVADAILEMAPAGLDPETVSEIVVETHSLAAGLDRTSWDTQLGALFSIPFVAATALIHGSVPPAASAAPRRDDPLVRALAQKVRVVVADDLDARLPAERAARVTVRSAEGKHTSEVPNPRGDADHHPFQEDEVVSLLDELIGPGPTALIRRLVIHDLQTSSDVAPLLGELSTL